MHTIRLRGPWHIEPLQKFSPQPDGSYAKNDGNLPPPASARMPADWSAQFGYGFLGRVRYIRKFQKPTGLETGERVFLVVEPPRSRGDVSLNGSDCGTVQQSTPWRCDITDHLQPHNLLEIIVDHPAADVPPPVNDTTGAPLPGGLTGEVRLEIEP